MHPIKPCKPYRARPAGTAVYESGAHCFKVYYVDIHGRPEPERYKWDLCGHFREAVIEKLAAAGIEGIGFVVAFPHITKVFRFAPSAEIVLHVRAYRTEDFSVIEPAREEGYLEFACYAEALIAKDEYDFWGRSASVTGYLRQWSTWADAAISDEAKLLDYYGR